MKSFDPFNLQDIAKRLQDELRRLSKQVLGANPEAGTRNSLMLELMRPNLGPTPLPLRRVLEPVVAACAVVALVTLLGLGAASFTLFLLASALMYAILTQVFGIELGLNMPKPTV